MSQPDQELAGKIVQHLDYGVDHLDRGTRERLLAARKVALSHYRERPETVLGLEWAGQAAAWISEQSRHGARHLITIAALVIALIGVAYWQNVASVIDVAAIDASLLTDELPINAFLDKGFESWLKRSSR
ncbi:MAG: DUF3619 family protein [Betaproteobacteria bacterium]|nr:DUF3619 family protein [Betaproteobacteria bacterium]